MPFCQLALFGQPLYIIVLNLCRSLILEVSYLAAAIAGLMSFLSPCVLPLVPGYLCYVAGTSLDQLAQGRDDAAELNRRVLITSTGFVLGFGTIFVGLGAAATALSEVLRQHAEILAQIAGAIIIVFGLQFIGLFRLSFLQRQAKLDVEGQPISWAGAYLVGLAFGFGWTPCIGPILATILTIAAAQDSVAQGMALLAVYAAGLGIPFLLAALGLDRFLRMSGGIRRHMRQIEVATGVLLVMTGVAFLGGWLQSLGALLFEWFPALGQLG